MKSNISFLENVGLKKNQQQIYLILLQFGELKVSDIVSKIGLQRSYIYDLLNELIEKGVIYTSIKNKVTFYGADNPDKILNLIVAQKKGLERNEDQYKKILPDLLAIQRKAIEKENAQMFFGKEGIKNIFEDILKTNKEFVNFGVEGQFLTNFKSYALNWHTRLNNQKLKYKLIYNASLKNRRPLDIQKKYVVIKFLPEKYSFPATIYVYGNKTAIVIWESNIAILINSVATAKTFYNYFDMLWQIAK